MGGSDRELPALADGAEADQAHKPKADRQRLGHVDGARRISAGRVAEQALTAEPHIVHREIPNALSARRGEKFAPGAPGGEIYFLVVGPGREDGA